MYSKIEVKSVFTQLTITMFSERLSVKTSYNAYRFLLLINNLISFKKKFQPYHLQKTVNSIFGKDLNGVTFIESIVFQNFKKKKQVINCGKTDYCIVANKQRNVFVI